MPVYYHCKACREDHLSQEPYAEDLYFNAAATVEVRIECPNTHEEKRYNRNDMYWRDEGVEAR